MFRRPPPPRFSGGSFRAARLLASAWLASAWLASAGCDGSGCAGERSSPEARATKRREELGRRWGAFSRCLLGEALRPGEKASERLRAIDLGALAGAPPAAAEGAAPPWPGRCTPALEALVAASGPAGAPDADLAALRRAGEIALRAATRGVPAYLANPGGRPLVDEIWESAAKSELAAAGFAPPAAPSSGAPPPVRPLLPGSLPSLGALRVRALRFDRIAGPAPRLLALGEGEAVGCRFELPPAGGVHAARSAAHGEAKGGAFCASLAPAASVLAAPISAERELAPLLFVDPSGFRGEPEPSGTSAAGGLLEGFSPAAFLRADGVVEEVLLGRGGASRLELGPSGVLERTALEAPRGAELFAFLPGLALFLEKRSRGKARLFALAPSAGAAQAEPIGFLPAGSEPAEACRPGEDAGVLVARSPAGPGRSRVSMIFWRGSAASAPVAADVDLEPSALARPEVETPTLACRAREATLTWARGLSVRQLRCTPEGCRDARSRNLDLAAPTPRAVAVDLEGKVLLVRASEAETPLGLAGQALVFRLAEAGALAEAPERVLVAGEAHGGVKGSLAGPWVRPVPGGALVAFRGGSALHAVRIDAAGAARPLPLLSKGPPP